MYQTLFKVFLNIFEESSAFSLKISRQNIKIANMILNEAIDNEFGIKKDDMTVIVAKINKKC